MAPAWRLWLAAVALMAFPGMSSIVAADASSNPEVVCGSVIKLESDTHKGFRLVTQDVAYGGGSGQMSVTTNPESDEDGYWVVRGAPGYPCEPGHTLATGDVIRLQHMDSRRWLHSHKLPAPLSGTRAHEVSSLGSDEESDTGDEWELFLATKGAKAWRRGDKVKLKHKDTEAWLSATGQKFPRPIQGHGEVAAVSRRGDGGTAWVAREGVYLPTRDLKQLEEQEREGELLESDGQPAKQHMEL